MSLLFGQTWRRLACLAVLSVIAMALVACGSGPGAKVQPEPVKILDVSFVKGETVRRISLVDKFSGSELTYTAESSDTSVATVAVDNAKDVLTVTAVVAGEATITVTAADSKKRTATQTFTVTVSEPDDEDEDEEEDEEEEEEEEDETPETPTTNNLSSCPSPLTIKLNGIAKCKVPSKATLQKPAGDGVSVARSDNKDEPDVWIIRAHSKGTYTVTILSGGAHPENIGTITVVVPNSAPSRNTTPPNPTADDPPKSGEPISITGTAPYFVGSLNLGQYFSDDDGADDIIRYSIGTWPDSILIDSKDGFTKTEDTSGDNFGSTLTFDALEEVTEDFQVTIYAHDDSERSQQSVVLTFSPPGTAGLVPRRGTYSVTQSRLGKLTDIPRVGARIGVPHILMFENTGDLTGFQFSRIKVEDLQGQDKLPSDLVNPGLYYVRDSKYFAFGIDQAGTSKAPYSDWTSTGDNSTDAGTNLYILRSTGVVEAEWPEVALSTPNPSVSFKLTGKGSGSITVEYYIWSGAITGAGNRRESANSGRLTLNIIVCNSPPNLITDCPLISP